MIETDGRWHQLVMLWIHDPAQFDEYLAAMTPIVGRYGGAADRIFAPTAIHADGLTTPDVVNLVHYDSRAAFDAFTNDPDFQRIKHLRDQSVDLLSFSGRLTTANPIRPETQQVYAIEVIQLPDSHPHREQDAAPATFEYILDIRSTDHSFDLATISSFPSTAQRAAYQNTLPHTGLIRVDATAHHSSAKDR